MCVVPESISNRVPRPSCVRIKVARTARSTSPQMEEQLILFDDGGRTTPDSSLPIRSPPVARMSEAISGSFPATDEYNRQVSGANGPSFRPPKDNFSPYLSIH